MPSVQIRDGLESDIAACLQLDHNYETDYVWQMTVEEEAGRSAITFNIQHLPRTLQASHAASEQRLRRALPEAECFLVAVDRTSDEIVGYLVMQVDEDLLAGLVKDLVVSASCRRQGIGTRLMQTARRWAREHNLVRLTVQNQTKNYPVVFFCQQMGLTFSGYSDQYFPNQDIAIFFSQSLR